MNDICKYEIYEYWIKLILYIFKDIKMWGKYEERKKIKNREDVEYDI
jgi:hypothetical protein